MIRKTIIAAAALASVAAIGSTQASAKVHVNIGVGLPLYASGPYYPVYDGYYDNDCHYKVIWKKKWSHKHHAFIMKKKKVLVCY
jgi:hypothetical protein